MANCSIPNSRPANGRISTKSLRRLRKQSKAAPCWVAGDRAIFFELVTQEFFNAKFSTLNAQCSMQRVRRWMLDVGRCVFSAIWRVKGAWWPSRSSKPSSSCKWRDRFDSYPLRLFIFDLRLESLAVASHPLQAISDWPVATAVRAVQQLQRR